MRLFWIYLFLFPGIFRGAFFIVGVLVILGIMRIMIYG